MRWAIVVGSFLTLNSISFAHGLAVEIRYWRENLIVRVCFDDGTPAAKADVKFHLPVSQSGTTDENGEVLFGMPNTTKIPISVDAGDGHVLKLTFVIPPGPWTDGQLLTSGISKSTSTPRRMFEILVGLLVIAMATLVLMKARPRRHPS